ncbi:MAG: hypothetical protein GY862_03820 [Gammaproteobacteria bacterium]|nr:hypothetical protein [Gammaproteobacteria bacterium]
MNENLIKNTLADKRILFVEDRLASIMLYMRKLEQAIPGVKITRAASLKKAWGHFNPVRSPPPFDIVLLDLNVPPVPPELRDYARRLEAGDLNEGQTLGLWLSENYPKVPYAYLTALPAVVDTNVDKSQKKITVVDKNLVSVRSFPEEIYRIWMQWQDE